MINYISIKINEQVSESISSDSSHFVTTIPINIGYTSSHNKMANEKALRSLFITRNPKICDNRPIIIGTRISVTNIVELYHVLGWSIEKIKEEYPFLNEEQIIAALEYYENNPKEIERYIREEKEIIEDNGGPTALSE